MRTASKQLTFTLWCFLAIGFSQPISSMEMDLGVISVKVKYLAGEAVSVVPEYEDCRTIAMQTGIPYQEVYRRAADEAQRQFLT